MWQAHLTGTDDALKITAQPPCWFPGPCGACRAPRGPFRALGFLIRRRFPERFSRNRGETPSTGGHRKNPAGTECEEAAITSAEANLAYVEQFVTEDESLLAARRNAAEVGGAVPIGPAGGATLRFLAAAIGAKAVVEIGTGCGTSGLYLLRGMRSDGVLTSVDVEPEHQELARTTFKEAGFPGNRYRLISGRALDVLPRLTDGAYDLVFCDAAKREYPDYLAEALRLLRPGGIVAFDNALWHDRVADPSQRDPETVVVRELGAQVRDDERLLPLLLPVGDGLLVAIKRTAS
jgi:predicted O-methyltransferase YrrM